MVIFCDETFRVDGYFGMNDSGYFEYNGDKPKEFGEQKYQESIKNYLQMEKRFKDLPDTRIVMVGTSPYDETVQLKENTPFKTKMKPSNGLLNIRKNRQLRIIGNLPI